MRLRHVTMLFNFCLAAASPLKDLQEMIDKLQKGQEQLITALERLQYHTHYAVFALSYDHMVIWSYDASSQRSSNSSISFKSHLLQAGGGTPKCMVTGLTLLDLDLALIPGHLLPKYKFEV